MYPAYASRLTWSPACPLSISAAGVGMDLEMSGEFIASAELFYASGIMAFVRLLAGVGSNVSRLVLKSVKGLSAYRTLVRSVVTSDHDC